MSYLYWLTGILENGQSKKYDFMQNTLSLAILKNIHYFHCKEF